MGMCGYLSVLLYARERKTKNHRPNSIWACVYVRIRVVYACVRKTKNHRTTSTQRERATSRAPYLCLFAVTSPRAFLYSRLSQIKSAFGSLFSAPVPENMKMISIFDLF